MIKVFKDNYNKSEFYSIMGKFFAEPSFKKELPYLTNRDNTVWHIFLENGEVKAFSSYEESSNKICFSTDYYLDDIKYLEDILKYKFKELREVNKPIDTATSNSKIKYLFEKYGFLEYKRTANYSFLIKEENKNE
ncbi:hypothetical protein [Clostridium sp.]|uniref:hypothetical protein n=1 Tax=Clostridium sp. TaxID=1506 RepID=UPI00260D9DCA|nr:hypothetical protein [Clostridium sp.]